MPRDGGADDVVNALDPLTALPNRAVAIERIEAALAAAALPQGPAFAVLFINGDRFNRINVTMGQSGGGGIIFDMGIYPIAMAQQFMGNPIKIHATGKVRPDGMDEESFVTLEYANGGRAQLTISGISSIPITAACSFDKAQVVVHEPFLAPSGISLRDKEFYFTQETNYPGNRFNNMWDFSYQISFYH